MKKLLYIFTVFFLGIHALSAQCTFTNPIKAAESSDPYVIFKNDYYYFMVTTGGGVDIRRAGKLQDVGNAPKVTVWTTNNVIYRDVWAPELHYINGKWYIYASGSINPNSTDQRMFCLEGNSQDAQGSYTFKGVMGNANVGAIDESVWIDPSSGKEYIAWSQFDPEGQCIYIAPMDNAWTIGNPRVKLSAPVNAWEKNGWNVNEGPIFLKRNNKLHIIYSASGCSTPDYCLGRLTCSDGNYLNASSWIKSNGPIFQRADANGVWGPGHNGFTTSPNGSEYWIIYHAKSSTQNINADRSTRIQRYTWNSDDTPNLGTPLATNVQIACMPTNTSTSYTGGPYIIPGTVEAENYDMTGEGLAYSDADATNNSGQYRNDGVDIEICSEGGYNVDWTNGGEWMQYSVNVAATTVYKMDARVTSAITGAAFHVEFDGVNVTGVMNVPNTGGWQNWVNFSKSFTLTAGTHKMRVIIESGGVNFNKFVFSSITTQTDDIGSSISDVLIYPNPNDGRFTIQADVSGNFKISLMNALGQIVYEKQLQVVERERYSIDTESLPLGMYVVRFQFKNEEQIQRIIKK